jgi:hypothetical protein
VANVKAERGSSGIARIKVNTVGFFDVWSIDVDFANESYTVVDDSGDHIEDVDLRFLSDSGPNGNKLLGATIRYSGLPSGEARTIGVGPGSATSGEGVVAYHAQIEEHSVPTSPIVTGSGSATRPADDLSNLPLQSSAKSVYFRVKQRAGDYNPGSGGNVSEAEVNLTDGGSVGSPGNGLMRPSTGLLGLAQDGWVDAVVNESDEDIHGGATASGIDRLVIQPDKDTTGSGGAVYKIDEITAFPEEVSFSERKALRQGRPQPWHEMDNVSVEEMEQVFENATADVGLPDFLLDYENLPPVVPAALQSTHSRASTATYWDASGNLVEAGTDELRLQRDPKTQEVLGLLYEPKRTQLISNDPTDASSFALANVNVSENVGSAKGLDYDKIVEANDTNEFHSIFRPVSPNAGDPVALSAIVKEAERNHSGLKAVLKDGDGGREDVFFQFDLGNITTAGTDSGSFSIIDHDIDDFGDGWRRIWVVLDPDSNWFIDEYGLFISQSGNYRYDGDGSSGIFFLHGQAEVSREPTTPILSGGVTRNADENLYFFAFPDTTSGVAYSIKQESGDKHLDGAHLTFGKTSGNFDVNHGVLMDERGLNDIPNDGWKTVTRNSDEVDNAEDSPLDETIDRFRWSEVNDFDARAGIYTVRKIAIHTDPHTSTQKSDLQDWLTTP